MSKLEETNLMIDYITKLNESGLNIDNTIMLADIAKSLAMIADKLYKPESESQESDDAISRQREKNISKGFEDFMIKSLRKQAESEE